MADKVTICNIALIKVGTRTITSLSDNTSEAKACDLLFDPIADSVMTEGAFTSTIARATLAQTTNTPAFEYTYEYALPNNPYCLRVLGIDEDVVGTYPFVIEGRKILTDLETLNIRYVSRVTNTAAWDPMLRQAFETRLAAELAYSVMGDRNKQIELMRMYQEILRQSIAIDSTNGSSVVISSQDLIEVR